MKKKAKKVILFLVEGASDLTSLEFIDNINTFNNREDDWLWTYN